MIRGYREHFAESNIQTRLSRKLFQATYALFPYHHRFHHSVIIHPTIFLNEEYCFLSFK